jgi:hypothetical protein
MQRFIPVTFAELHGNLFMQGSNLTSKINAAQRGAKLVLDTELGVIWIKFKGKVSLIPLANTASLDAVVPEELMVELGFNEEPLSGPPAVRRGKQKAQEEWEEPLTDEDAHRAAVRLASATSNKAPSIAQTDTLIQETRGKAMGFKDAQVSNPTQPTTGASVVGKTKALSHAQLRAQVAQEAKDVK